MSTTPQDGALGIDIYSINLRFNEGISHTLLTLTGMTLTNFGEDGNPGSGDDLATPLEKLYTATSISLTIYPSDVLSPGNYLLTVDNAIIADLDGNFLTSPIEIPFSNSSGIDLRRPCGLPPAAATGITRLIRAPVWCLVILAIPCYRM